jgi:PAS domain S-box-containing protein
MKKNIINKDFISRIILPTLLVFTLFTVLIFAIIIPSIKSYMLEAKHEMIRELTNTAWSVFNEFDSEVEEGILSIEQAQAEAINRIKNMRYGHEGKDYFWITDMHPNMVMHPYRNELNNKDLSEYEDPTGKKLFVESINVVKSNQEGYIYYMWQWKDDSTKIVPKLSFVKAFEKWGWVIGTGIYLEDVNEEISSLTSNLFYLSAGILFLLAFILFFISKQSLIIEIKRLDAETGLKESEAKYKALVETSTDGLVMMLDGKYIYSNHAFMQLLGYKNEDASVIELNKVLYNDQNQGTSGFEFFKKLELGELPENNIQAQLKTIDGRLIDVLLCSSAISLSDKAGYTIIVKDISTHKLVEEELDKNKEKYLNLANTINIGVFRAKWSSKGEIIDLNNSAAKILGYSNTDELRSFNLLDFIHNSDDKKDFKDKLIKEGSIKNSILDIKTKDGSVAIVSISAVLVKDSNDTPQYIDGTIDDISDKMKIEEERENLIVELQTSLRFLNQPISHFLKNSIECNLKTPIYKVAKLMTKSSYSAALIKTDSGEFVGIITDQDLRSRVVSANYNLESPIFEVMSSPLLIISSEALVFEAFLMMNENSTRHLAVKNQDNNIVGIISSEELVTVQRHSTTYLRREIEKAESVDDLVATRDKQHRLVKVLVDSGARSKIISQIITSLFDAITERLIQFAIAELGEPPTKFAFIALGSIGRKEQTLISDQDNAIIYEDVHAEHEKQVHAYFFNLATKVCDWLNECGYVYCPGEAMAKNPKWCQSISIWEKHFHSWIVNSDQQDLINLNIFFDFRTVYGKTELTENLRKYLFNVVEGQAGFFQHLAKNSLVHKPPVGLLGNIVLESKGDHRETFDIKSAIMPISDFSRIYALKNKISAVNSIERLEGLVKKGIINKVTFEELKQAHNYLMQLRFKHQAEQIVKNVFPDNYINPNTLTQVEQKTLKNIFTQIVSIQKKLNYDFTGEAL